MTKVAIVSLIGLWILLLVGCQTGGGGGQPSEKPNEATPRPPAASTPTNPAASTPAAKGPQGQTPTAADDQIALAKQDLANRQGVAASSITVTKVEEIQWPDSSLGCPEPGKMYAQMITPGYRIVLEANGKSYEYHADKGKNVVLCSR